jgi:hypothetical protein
MRSAQVIPGAGRVRPRWVCAIQYQRDQNGSAKSDESVVSEELAILDGFGGSFHTHMAGLVRQGRPVIPRSL